jgi:hypothetical protein
LPPTWSFQGGTVYFDLSLSVYVDEGFGQHPEALALVLEHEWLHVADEIETVTRYLPAQAPNNQHLRRYLIDGEPVDERRFKTGSEVPVPGRTPPFRNRSVWVFGQPNTTAAPTCVIPARSGRVTGDGFSIC